MKAGGFFVKEECRRGRPILPIGTFLGEVPARSECCGHRFRTTTTCLVGGLLGIAAGMLFVIWRRRCIQILGPGMDAKTANLVVDLLGLGGGWIAFRCWSEQFTRCQHFLFLLILGTMAATVVGERLAPVLNFLATGIFSLRSSAVANAIACGLIACVLQFVPALGFGAVLARLIAAPPTDPSTTLRTLTINVACFVGGIIGLEMASNWLLPSYGTLTSVADALAILLIVHCLLSWRQPQGQPSALIFLAVAGIIIASLGDGLGGGYFYGQRAPYSRMPEVRLFSTGLTYDVLVSEGGGQPQLQFDGIPVIRAGPDLAGEFGLAYFPRFLRPQAKQVLVIGLGTGAVSGASLLFPRTEVVCSESEPAAISAVSFFKGHNHHPESSSAFCVVNHDARAYLRASTRPFDLILVEYVDPRLPDTVRFIAKQFFTSAAHALAPEGILACRLRIDAFSTMEIACVARTILAAFPHAALFQISDSTCLFLASRSSLVSLPQVVREAQSLVDGSGPIHTDLSRHFGTSNVAVLIASHLLLGDDDLRQMAARDQETALVSDWDSHMPSGGRRHSLDDQGNGALVNRWILASTTLSAFKQQLVACNDAEQRAFACHQLEHLLAANGLFRKALGVVDLGLASDPNQPDLLADRLIWSRQDDPKIIGEIIGSIAVRSVEAANRVGVSLWERKEYPKAIIVFTTLTKLRPDSATLWCNLGVNYQAGGQIGLARQCFERALALDPLNDFIKRTTPSPPAG